jgi:hypothetical protein
MASCDDKEGYEGCVTLKFCDDELLLALNLYARNRAVGPSYLARELFARLILNSRTNLNRIATPQRHFTLMLGFEGFHIFIQSNQGVSTLA